MTDAGFIPLENFMQNVIMTHTNVSSFYLVCGFVQDIGLQSGWLCSSSLLLLISVVGSCVILTLLPRF